MALGRFKKLFVGLGLTGTDGGDGSLTVDVHVDNSTVEISADAVRVKDGGITEAKLSLSDVTTGNVTSTKHGFAPKTPADATKFLNGAATAAFAQVKDSDLSTSDVTTNDASTSKHGFLKKLSNVAANFLDGTGVWRALVEGDLALTDITTNDVTTSRHGFTPKAPNDVAKFLRGDGAWAAPGGGGGGSSTVASDVIWDNKGDLAVASAADAASVLPVGANGYVIVADSTQTLGMKWVPASTDLFNYLSAR